jgi:transposase InsO family protein
LGSKGDCSDNAVAESFFATLRKEPVHRRSRSTRRALQRAAFDYVETFYDRERRHSTLGYLSPRELEMISLSKETEKKRDSES